MTTETGKDVKFAFALTIAAGFATVFGGIIIFFKSLVHMANPRSLAIALGCSCGVMLFISLAEIFPESIEKFEESLQEEDECSTSCKGNAHLLSMLTFLIGVALVYLMDFIVHKVCPDGDHDLEIEDLEALQGQDPKCPHAVVCTPVPGEDTIDDATRRDLNRTGVITALALALHNLPEGVATFIAALEDTKFGIALAVGIALHNIPEGIAVAAPVYFASGSRMKSLAWTFIAAIMQPVGGLLAWLIVGDGMNASIEGAMFGIVAGMMTSISITELLPTAFKFAPEGNAVHYSVFFGMLIMAASIAILSYGGL